MPRCATRPGLILFVLFLSSAAIAQQTSGGAIRQRRQRRRRGSAVKRIVDGIMQPYLAQTQVPGAIVGVSLHGHRYFFPYGKATDAGAPFTPDTLVEIGSCTKTFTTTLFALALNRNQMVADASAQKYMPSGYTLKPAAQAMTPLELADFTSGLPDDPNESAARVWKQRSIEHYTTKDFLTWVSRWAPATKLPAPYLYSNAGIGLLSYLVMTATGKHGKSSSTLRFCSL